MAFMSEHKMLFNFSAKSKNTKSPEDFFKKKPKGQ